MEDQKSINLKRWSVAVFVATLFVVTALTAKMFLLSEPPISLLTAIVVVAGLMILSPRIFELAELTISKEGVVAKLQEMEDKVKSTEQEIKNTEKKIDKIFAYTMSDSMFSNLKKLSTGNFGHFKNNGGLRRELRHLRDVGYISVQGHIGDLPDQGVNLSEYVTVLPVGKDFIELRESLEKNKE